jgi:hypothetical protein
MKRRGRLRLVNGAYSSKLQVRQLARVPACFSHNAMLCESFSSSHRFFKFSTEKGF